MSSIRWLVCYDVADEKRLRHVARACEQFGARIQFSVFECPLDGIQLAQLKGKLGGILNHHEDQVLFVPLGRVDLKGVLIDYIGRQYSPRDRVTII